MLIAALTLGVVNFLLVLVLLSGREGMAFSHIKKYVRRKLGLGTPGEHFQ